jgi:hypothetical protein
MPKTKQEIITLYTDDQHAETADQITKMAIRFHVTEYNVIHALWLGSKDTVWAKLEQDVKEKKRQMKKERAEAANK